MKEINTLGAFGLMVLFFLVGLLVGGHWQARSDERQIVSKGHAKWVADPKGNPVFTWNDTCGIIQTNDTDKPH